MELIAGYRTKMSQNRRCRRPSRTPVTSSHQNPILKIELAQNRRRHRSSRLPRVDVTSSHQNLILKIELAQNRRRHRSSRLPRVDVTSSNENPILKIELSQNRPFPTTPISGNSEARAESFSDYDDVFNYTSDISSTLSHDEPDFTINIQTSAYTELRDEIQMQDVRIYSIPGEESAVVGHITRFLGQKHTGDLNLYQSLLRSRMNAAEYSTITNTIINGEGQRDIDNIPDYSELREEIESQDVHEYTHLSVDPVELATLLEKAAPNINASNYQHLRRSRTAESEYSAVSISAL